LNGGKERYCLVLGGSDGISHLVVLFIFRRYDSPQIQAYNAVMPRKLVWIETQEFLGFGCSDCRWVFNHGKAALREQPPNSVQLTPATVPVIGPSITPAGAGIVTVMMTFEADA